MLENGNSEERVKFWNQTRNEKQEEISTPSQTPFQQDFTLGYTMEEVKRYLLRSIFSEQKPSANYIAKLQWCLRWASTNVDEILRPLKSATYINKVLKTQVTNQPIFSWRQITYWVLHNAVLVKTIFTVRQNMRLRPRSVTRSTVSLKRVFVQRPPVPSFSQS